MAERKPLFMGSEGFSEEMATADSITLGGLTMGGNIDMNSAGKVIGSNPATTAGDLLAYGQSAASLAGLTLTGDLNMSGTQKITNLAQGTLATDGVNKDQLDTAVITGGSVKELVLYPSQLDNAEGILGAIALVINTNPASGDTITITDGTNTRTYGAGSGGDVQYTIGANPLETMANLATAISNDAHAQAVWDAAYSTDLDSISSGVVVIWEEDNDGTDSKLYGVWGTPASVQVVDFGGEVEYTKKTLTTMPGSLPGSTNFGFRRTQSALTDGEIHYASENDTAYSWNDSGNVWVTMTGPYSIPDATSASGGGTKGKVTFDSDFGLQVNTGIAKINLEASTPGLQFVTGALSAKVNNGLELTANGIEVDLAATPGLQFITGDLSVLLDPTEPGLQLTSGLKILLAANPGLELSSGLKAKVGNGLELTATGIEVDLATTNPGLQFVGNDLAVLPGDGILVDANGVGVDLSATPGLQLVGTSPNKELEVLPDGTKGIEVGASGVAVKLETDAGIVFDGSNGGLEINLEATNPSLQISGNELGVKLDAAGAIVKDAGGIQVNLEATNPSLQIASNELGLKIDANGGLQKTASGVSIKLDEPPDTLALGANGLKVTGLPSLFKINDVAVGATVTAANLDTLTDTSNADALHTHTGLAVAEAERIENDLNVDEAIAAADPVYFTATGDRVGKARADTDSKARVIGVAKTAQGTVGLASTIISIGECAGILSTATPGTAYYLQAAGGIGTALPGAGHRVIQVGVAASADDLWVRIVDYGKKAA